MTKHMNNEDPIAFLLGIADPEERARMARAWGLADELAERDHFGWGSGPEVALNAAIYGSDEESRIGAVMQDENLIADEVARRAAARAEKQRAAEFLTLDDLESLYEATGFLNQELGLTWNSLITIAYEPLGVGSSGDRAARLLTKFLDEGAKFMRRSGHEFHWIYAHERSDERGVHTHILTHVPAGMGRAFRVWALDDERSFFRRRCAYVRPGAVDFVMKQPKTRRSKLQWQGDRLQYLTKGFDPEAAARDPDSGKMEPIFDLLKQKENYRRPAGVVPFRKRCGASGTVGASAQARVLAEGMPIMSPMLDEAWTYLHLDSFDLEWPLREHDERQRERDLQFLLASLEGSAEGETGHS